MEKIRYVRCDNGCESYSGEPFFHFENLTGNTVFLCGEGILAMADMGGTAMGTRQIDAFSLGHLVDLIHGVCLPVGSAFGLDAAGGVMNFWAGKDLWSHCGRDKF